MSLDLFIAASAGMAVGAVAGGLIAARRRVNSNYRAGAVRERVPDPTPSDRVDEAAARWARDNGSPEVADLVAAKLRLGLAVQERRRRRRQIR